MPRKHFYVSISGQSNEETLEERDLSFQACVHYCDLPGSKEISPFLERLPRNRALPWPLPSGSSWDPQIPLEHREPEGGRTLQMAELCGAAGSPRIPGKGAAGKNDGG